MPTTGWSSCGARHARCCRASWTSGGAAPSSRAPSATSWCARASPGWSSSTSATRRSTSGASTGCPTRATVPPTTARRWGSPSTSAAWPSRARTTSPWWSTGAPRWPSRSTGRPGSTPRGWPAAATSPCAAGPCSGWRTSTSSTPTAGAAVAAPGRPGPRRGRGAPALRRHGAGWPGALLSALGQARTGHMGDIIGTIQREQDEIIRSPLAGRPRRPGRPGDGQDGGGAAPCRLPALHAPLPARAPGRARRRAQPALPALHRAGAPLAGGDGREPVDGGGPRARGPGARRRRPRRRQAQGRRADGQGAGAGRAHPSAAAAPRRGDPVRCRRAAPARRATEDIVAVARRRPGTHNARRRFVESQVFRALWPTTTGPARTGRDRELDDAGEPRRSRTTWPQRLRRVPEVAEALDRMWPRLSPHEFSMTFSAPARCWRPPARGSSTAPRCSGSTGPGAPPSTRCPGRWPTPR